MTHRIAALLPLLLALPADFPTIQGAIDAATHGDQIVVATDSYRENIPFRGRTIILRSSVGESPVIVRKTIIAANRLDSVVTFEGIEESNAEKQMEA